MASPGSLKAHLDEAFAKGRTVTRIGPQPGPQVALLSCTVPEVLFGGARGGGKTFGWQLKWLIKARRYGAAFNAIMFRREMPAADDAIESARQLYGAAGAAYHKIDRQFTFRNGARIRFRPLYNSDDADKYQGQNVSDAAVEEAQQHESSAAIDKLWGALRSTAGVPAQLILTANPGGAGNSWLKSRFIDPAPGGMKILRQELPNGRTHRRVYIPSRVENNRILLARDPDYVSRLYLVGSAALVRAWLEGDWGAIEGAFFDKWRAEKHIIAPFKIPDHWTRFTSLDWGYAKPFSIGWWAVVGDDCMVHGRVLLRGTLVRYREWYGVQRVAGGRFVPAVNEFGMANMSGDPRPNVGVRLDADVVARAMLALEARAGEAIDYRIADPAIFASESGPSVGEQFAGEGVAWLPADNKRAPGWAQMRARMLGEGGDPVTGEGGAPMAVWFETCADSIRILPGLPHDRAKAEDLDTDSEDHIADETRYAMMSRPWARPEERPDPARYGANITIDEAWALGGADSDRIK